MQIKLGEKIRELRRRDGRKQEDLASALGVTNQAVSRWEANGGYPDMEMIPSIANYFHITIDELFGYDSDRQIKLQSYLDQADKMLDTPFEKKDNTLRVEFLRKAISEFPSDWQLQYRLADALVTMGHEKQKERKVVEGAESFRYNTESNAQNECWKEAVSLYEKVLKQEIDDDSRIFTVTALMWLYSLMGNQESAERLAFSQPPIRISREILLAGALKDEKSEGYRGEAILNLIHELYMVMSEAVMTKHVFSHSQTGLDMLLAVARLYESVFSDGNYGIYHNDMSMLFLRCSSIAIRMKDSERALHYFETALDHFLEFRQARAKSQFTAPLINQAKNYRPSIVLLNRESFEEYMQSFPAGYADAIKNNPKYASIFEQQ